MNYALILTLASKSNEEVVEFARAHGIYLTVDDVKFIKSSLQDASFEWLVSGIPKYKIIQLEKRLGKETVDKLFKLFST